MRSTTGLKNNRGFTLLELILVMAIISIAVGMAIPSLHGFAQGRRAGNCAEEILALAHWARTQAVVRGKPYRLNLDPAAGTFWLTVQEDDGTIQPLGEEFGRTFTVPEGVRLDWDATPQADGTYVQFLPTGRCDPATIHVTAPDGHVTELTCLSGTELFHIVTDQERVQG